MNTCRILCYHYYNQLLDEVFVILGIIKAEVSDINQAEGQGR